MDADHVGGNEKLAGPGSASSRAPSWPAPGLGDDVVSNFGRASVLAHENVLARMTARPAAIAVPFALWPTKTFAYQQYSMYLNGEGIQVIHSPTRTPTATRSCSSAAAT